MFLEQAAKSTKEAACPPELIKPGPTITRAFSASAVALLQKTIDLKP